MTYQQKAEALEALADLTLGLTMNKRWVASVARCEVGGDGILRSLVGYGETPQDAIDSLWASATILTPGLCVVVDAYGDRRRKVRWNNFMWQDVQ